MPDWKEMYLTLMRDTERAVRILTESQQRCEELYLREDGPILRPLPLPDEPSPRDEPSPQDEPSPRDEP